MVFDDSHTLDLEKENLRAQIKTLQYEVSSLKSDREFEKLRHEQDVQDVRAKADADFKKAQVCQCMLIATSDISELSCVFRLRKVARTSLATSMSR